MTSEKESWRGVFRLTAELAPGELERWDNCPVPQGVCRNAWYLEGGVLLDPWDDPEWGVELLQEELPGPVKMVIFLSNPRATNVLDWLKAQNPELNVVPYTSGRQPITWQNWSFEFFDDAQRPERGMVFEKASGVLFSGELFSSPGETEGIRNSSSLTPAEKDFFEHQALLWYASRGPFSSLGRVAEHLDVKALAPRLGLGWAVGQEIQDWYEEFASWANRGPEAVTLWGAPPAGFAEPWFAALTAGLSSTGLDLQLMDQTDPIETVAAAVLSSRALVVLEQQSGQEENNPIDNLLAICRRLGLKRQVFTLVPLPADWAELGELLPGPSLTDWIADPQKATEAGRQWGLRLKA